MVERSYIRILGEIYGWCKILDAASRTTERRMIMTDNEIVIALRAVAKSYEGKPLRTFETNINAMATDAANHIERLYEENNLLKAEIERLKKKDNEWALSYVNSVARGIRKREEAIKEFAERLKDKVVIDLCEAIVCSDYLYNLPKLIDNLLKEMEKDV